jgi:hypothetical protein
MPPLSALAPLRLRERVRFFDRAGTRAHRRCDAPRCGRGSPDVKGTGFDGTPAADDVKALADDVKALADDVKALADDVKALADDVKGGLDASASRIARAAHHGRRAISVLPNGAGLTREPRGPLSCPDALDNPSPISSILACNRSVTIAD